MKRKDHPEGHKIFRGRKVTGLRLLRLFIYLVIIAVMVHWLREFLN